MLKTITILTILTLIYGLDIDFEPVNVWKYFQQLSATPRPSYYHYKVVSFLKNYGDANNFTVRQDRIGNLAIEIPSTVKRDKIPKVCLQAHYDMVAEKNDDKEFDFEHDAIELIRDGEWIRANMTTLGADDGIGVAVALAVATDKNSRHGPLELVFTKGTTITYSNML
jgi:dipeptidase D